MRVDVYMTLWDEIFKTGLFLEKNTFVFIGEGTQKENLPISILK
jgi:hypothetical protein